MTELSEAQIDHGSGEMGEARPTAPLAVDQDARRVARQYIEETQERFSPVTAGGQRTSGELTR